ncbi:2-amino-4-hydroxy-6-hydroxymethyldihydropteridine diphosphokinase [Pseudoneobacillus sp. C159]
MENMAYIALGSNIPDRFKHLMGAIEFLEQHVKINVVKTSSIYETDPVGYTEQESFLNMVALVKTDLKPHDLLKECLKIEAALGRKREIRWGPRTVDLDILIYNQETINTEELIVPHPRMMERAFVLVPLLEIASDLSLPSIHDINILELQEKEGVRLWKRKSWDDAFAPIEN